MLAFVHIEKAAGTTIYYILRAAFGLRHLDVKTWNKKRDTLNAEDLKKYFILNPFVLSIAGHSIRPYSDLEKICPNINYFTFVKQPIERYISHYRYRVNEMNFNWSFAEYLKMDEFKNFQVKKIAGSSDLEKAKEYLTNFLFVGIAEKFDLSLVLLRKKIISLLAYLGYANDFNIDYFPRNISSSRKHEKCETDLCLYSQEILENNKIDMELYRWISEILFEKEKLKYDGNLTAELENFVKTKENPNIRKGNLLLNRLIRNILFRPFNEAVRSSKICK